MKAHYKIEAGDVSVIRPLIYIREHQTKAFAQAVQLPIINENCPACFEDPKERHRVKKMLARYSALDFDKFYRNSHLSIINKRLKSYWSTLSPSPRTHSRACLSTSPTHPPSFPFLQPDHESVDRESV